MELTCLYCGFTSDEQKYSIVVKNKIFATNLTLKQCMKLSVYLGKKGINHSEKRIYDR